MSEYYNEFRTKALKKFTEDDINHALNQHFQHPKLARRLLTLKKQKVKLSEYSENPWYDEMNDVGITDSDITILGEYLKFKEQKNQKEMKEFQKRKKYCRLRADYLSFVSAKSKIMIQRCIQSAEPKEFNDENEQ